MGLWIVLAVVAVLVAVRLDHVPFGRAVALAIAYPLIGLTFGLTGIWAARTLLRRVPTEGEARGTGRLRLFRLKVVGVYVVLGAALAFTIWTTRPQIAGSTVVEVARTGGEQRAAIMLGWSTFLLVQIGTGWYWGQLGRRPIADRPDGATSEPPVARA